MPGDLRERERKRRGRVGHRGTELYVCLCACLSVCVCESKRESVRVSSRGAVLNPCSIVTAHMTEDTKLSIKHTNVVCERISPAFFNMPHTILTKKKSKSEQKHTWKGQWFQYFQRKIKFITFLEFLRKVSCCFALKLLSPSSQSCLPPIAEAHLFWFQPEMVTFWSRWSRERERLWLRALRRSRPLSFCSPSIQLSVGIFSSFSSMYVPPMSSSTSPLPLPLGDANAVVRLELKAANRVALCCGALGWC